MNTSRREPFQISVSYLYDPIPLGKVELDALKDSFPEVQSLSESEVIFADAAQKKQRAQIQSARLDYVDEEPGEFRTKDLGVLKVLLKALPNLLVKALGVTLYLKVVVEGQKDAGLYTINRFLNLQHLTEEALGAKLIAAATRITYGEPTKFFDLRVTPDDIGSDLLYLHLRNHMVTNLADSARIYEESATIYQEACNEMDRLLTSL